MSITAFTARQDLANMHTQEDWTDWSPFTYPFNFTGQPACVMPCGLTEVGLPVGLQIVGPRYADLLVMWAAGGFEHFRPFQMPDAANVTH